VILFIRI